MATWTIHEADGVVVVSYREGSEVVECGQSGLELRTEVEAWVVGQAGHCDLISTKLGTFVRLGDHPVPHA